KAISNLRRKNLLSLRAVARTPLPVLEKAVRPARYFRSKARYLRGIARHFMARDRGNLASYFKASTAALRKDLLSLRGIGPETADSILLYAGGKASFVIDAYTRRIFSRIGLVGEKAGYMEMQAT